MDTFFKDFQGNVATLLLSCPCYLCINISSHYLCCYTCWAFKFTIVYFCLWFLYQFFWVLVPYVNTVLIWPQLILYRVHTFYMHVYLFIYLLHFVTLLNKHSINLTLHDIAVLMHAAKTVFLSKLSHLLHFFCIKLSLNSAVSPQ